MSISTVVPSGTGNAVFSEGRNLDRLTKKFKLIFIIIGLHFPPLLILIKK